MAIGVAKKPAIDLAIVMGPKRGKGHMDHGPGDEGEDEGEDDSPDSERGEGEELPPGFEEAAAEAFPDMAHDMEKLQALKRLIHLCSDSY